MKLFCFGDTHVSDRINLAGQNGLVDADGCRYVSGITARRSLVEADRMFDWIFNQARKSSPDVILFLGDLYDRARPSPDEEFLSVNWFREIASIAPTVCLLGNHTQSSSTRESALASLKAASIEGLTVVERPRFIEFESGALFCVPYPPIGRFKRDGWTSEKVNGKATIALGKIVSGFADRAHTLTVPTVLAGHVTFAGAEFDSGHIAPRSEVQCPTSRLADFDAVVAGHIHKRQQITGARNGYYVGPPDRSSFSDERKPVGGVTLDVTRDGADFRWTNYRNARRFQTVDCERLDTDVLQPGQYLRVRGEVATQSEYAALCERLEALRDDQTAVVNEATIRVAPRTDRLATVDSNADLGAIFDLWLSQTEIPEDIDDSALFEIAQEAVTKAQG